MSRLAARQACSILGNLQQTYRGKKEKKIERNNPTMAILLLWDYELLVRKHRFTRRKTMC